MITLTWIKPNDLHDHWPQIKEGLKQVRKYGSNEWMPEDVYMSIKMGESHLHVGYDGEQYLGFIVTQTQKTHKGAALHIWAVYSQAKDFNLLREVMPTLKEWAGNVSAHKLTFSSNRHGWKKAAEKLGFEETVTWYEQEL